MTILSLQAWRRTSVSVPVPASATLYEPVEIMPMYEIPQAPRVSRSRRISTNGRVHAQSGNGSARLTPAPQPRLRSNNRVKKMKEPVVRTKKKRGLQRKPTIQLAMIEEHRCPYCLDPVSRNDPRGVKECDVCHTLHHADCWAITGVCQVPHLNT
jgi:ribosomal protein L37AE/L43A